jgi:hypothetical protein
MFKTKLYLSTPSIPPELSISTNGGGVFLVSYDRNYPMAPWPPQNISTNPFLLSLSVSWLDSDLQYLLPRPLH